jgi:ribonucleoside-diphosphate reductase alpha chain
MVQRQLPRRRRGFTTAVTIGGEAFVLIANENADGTLGEVFIRHGKHGTGGAGLMDMFATVLSVGLAHRVPLAELLRPGLGLHFTPSGHTDDPEIPRARSVVDYLARRLAIDWLPYPERAALGVWTLTERVRDAGTWMTAQDPAPAVHPEYADNRTMAR